jgi:hypothetical protein
VGLKVLITNVDLSHRSGTQLYVADLALELRRQRHSPAVYTLVKGCISDELEQAGIPVSDHLGQVSFQPDVIHGHHHFPALAAIQHFPDVPAVFICHDHSSGHAPTPLHPRIRRYFGVSRICVERLILDGVPPGQAQLLLNFVDTQRFRPRPPLPERPRRALVFSNYARAETNLPAISAACRQAGLELDVVGAGVYTAVTRPEEVLGRYDLVFAKARAAMEALAVGTAVILCDFAGLGPMVTSAEYASLRPLNFGFQALREPLRPENILNQIARYDAADAAQVRDLIRAEAGLDQAVTNLVGIYRAVIEEQTQAPLGPPEASTNLHLRRRRLLRRPIYTGLAMFAALAPRHRELLRMLPGVEAVKVVVGRLLK